MNIVVDLHKPEDQIWCAAPQVLSLSERVCGFKFIHAAVGDERLEIIIFSSAPSLGIN